MCTDSLLELELPTSPEVPLLGAGGSSGGGDSGTSGGGKAGAGASPLHHRPHGGSAAAAASEAEAGGGSGLQPPHQQQQGQGRAPRRSAAEVWEGARAVLSSKGFWKYKAMCIFTGGAVPAVQHVCAWEAGPCSSEMPRSTPPA